MWTGINTGIATNALVIVDKEGVVIKPGSLAGNNVFSVCHASLPTMAKIAQLNDTVFDWFDE